MSDDFEDLLGGPPKPKLGRPTREMRAARAEAALQEAAKAAVARKAAIGRTVVPEEAFFNPVGVNFLCRLLHMDSQTVRTRLRGLAPCAMAGANRPMWHFHETLPYLVKSKMTAEQFAKTLNKADLPPEINKAFWDSQRSRVKYKIEAQEAWETDDVQSILSDVSMTINDVLRTAPEEMRGKAKLTDEQLGLFEAAIDDLRLVLRQKLVEMPTRRSTKSMFDQPLFGVSGEVDREPMMPEDDVRYLEYDGEEDV